MAAVPPPVRPPSSAAPFPSQAAGAEPEACRTARSVKSVTIAAGSPGVRAPYGADRVPDGVPRHDPVVGARVEAVAERDRVDAGDACLGAQPTQQRLPVGVAVGGQHGDEDRFVGPFDGAPQRLGGRRGERVAGARVDVDGAGAQCGGRGGHPVAVARRAARRGCPRSSSAAARSASR